MITSLLLTGSIVLMNTAAAAPDIPLREHPRPDFERPAWVNLNGTWQFDFDPDDVGIREAWNVPGRHAFGRQIVVPFPWESRLSGIADTRYQGAAWYSRRFTLPAGEPWAGREPWLIIGACDWEARVWVNGQPAGDHVGGYVPFEINLAPYAKPGEQVTVTVRAVDRSDGEQPTGKQVNWYTRTSGIWQTVYLEPRATARILSLRGEPDIAAGCIRYDVALAGASEIESVTAASPAGEFPDAVAGVQAAPDALSHTVSLVVRPTRAERWTPESPKLYPVEFTIRARGRTADRVRSYFGLRSVSVGAAPGRDYQYIQLNGKPVYLRGALHQSFHPEGIYQYPSDAVLRSDYELCKQIGINFLRIHIKAPIPRELYWADRLGVMIMQDMPCYWVHTPRAVEWWKQMLAGVIARDFNHPAIISWVDFNETWGIEDQGYTARRQEWVEEMYRLTRQYDSTRLVEDNSPCKYDHVRTDINSWHFYINDYEAARSHIREVVDKTFPGSTFNYIGNRKQGREPLINSEYGGISAGLGDQDISWCFKFLTNELRLHDKVCGYIYTELSDIEWEHNGFANYDRTHKAYGYDFWHPGMSLADLNGPDFVVIDAPPMIPLKPGQKLDIPVRISHWSDRAGTALTLRYRVDWLDAFGRRQDGEWQSRPARWEPFRVVPQEAPVSVQAEASGPGIAGALLVQVLDGDQVVARNYVNLCVDRGPAPRVEAVDRGTVALRFTPADFAEWTFDNRSMSRRSFSVEKAAGLGRGAVEYELRTPEGLALDRIRGITFLAELAAKAGDEKLDWPERRKAVDYPQTDARSWPTDVTVSINGRPVGTVTLADDPADAHGAISHFRGHQGSYGYLVRQTLAGQSLDAVRGALARDRVLRIRLEVAADARHCGGLSIYGQNSGCYPVDPTVLLTFDGGHGLASDYRSAEPVAANAAMRVLLPGAESGRHDWRYTTNKPAEGWTSADFDDSGWMAGPGGFGTRGTPGAINNTRWASPDIWLRTSFDLGAADSVAAAQWRIYHDEDAELFLNGTKVLALEGYEPQYIDVPLDAAALKALRPGKNTLAVHCRQTAGMQGIDVGLSSVRPRAK
jgi:hypothetical protein